jgi:hypothetical protein
MLPRPTARLPARMPIAFLGNSPVRTKSQDRVRSAGMGKKLIQAVACHNSHSWVIRYSHLGLKSSDFIDTRRGRRKPKAQGQCQQSRQPRAHSSALANFLAPDPALKVLIRLKPAYFLRAACWDDAGETLAVATRRRKLGLCSACFLSRSVTSSILSFSKPLRLAIMR